MIPLKTGTGFTDLKNAMKASGSLRKKTAILLRFLQFNPPADPRNQPQRVDSQFPITGHFHEVTAKEILDSNGYYVAGDILSNTEKDIQGISNVKGAGLQADRLLFEGFTYQAEGKPYRKMALGGRLYTTTHWRKIN